MAAGAAAAEEHLRARLVDGARREDLASRCRRRASIRSKLADALAVGPLGRPIGIDAMRYYLLREVPLGLDGDFTFESLFGRFNAELANDLGNLVNRALTLMAKSPLHPPARRCVHRRDRARTRQLEQSRAATRSPTRPREYEAIAPSRALEAIWKLVREANKYVDDDAAVGAREGSDASRPSSRTCCHMLASVIGVDRRARRRRCCRRPARTLREWVGDPRGRARSLADRATMLRGRRRHAREASRQAAVPAPRRRRAGRRSSTQRGAATTAGAAPRPRRDAKPPKRRAAPIAATITYDDFAKLELRVGKVRRRGRRCRRRTSCSTSTVDLGEAKPRSIVAGIAAGVHARARSSASR